MNTNLHELVFEENIQRCEGGFSTLCIRGDDSLTAFLNRGGIPTEREFKDFLLSLSAPGKAEHINPASVTPVSAMPPSDMLPSDFGCSVFSAGGKNGGYLFGRNFDLRHCDMLILKNIPKTGYASFSTVNPDFIIFQPGKKWTDPPYEKYVKKAAMFLPMDGMNEKGLCAAVNKIQDDVTVNQTAPGKTSHNTGTVIRELLNRAADVDEAINILENSNLRFSRAYFVHFIVSDAKGRCICAEYLDNRLHIIESPIVTNHYLTPGEKFGIGTDQSHVRFGILSDILRKKNEKGEPFSREDVKQALASVAKHNFPEDGERFTEWSVIYDQSKLSACYYRRENYDDGYTAALL